MTLSLKEREFVQAARFMGVPGWRIIFRHILPNMSSLLIIDATVNVSSLILAEVGLSFFGFGVQPPDVSLGTLIGDYAERGADLPVAVLLPGRLRSSCWCCRSTWSATALRDALDPQRGRPERHVTSRPAPTAHRAAARGRRTSSVTFRSEAGHVSAVRGVSATRSARRGARHRRRVGVGQVRVVAGRHGPAAATRARDRLGPLSRARS